MAPWTFRSSSEIPELWEAWVTASSSYWRLFLLFVRSPGNPMQAAMTWPAPDLTENSQQPSEKMQLLCPCCSLAAGWQLCCFLALGEQRQPGTRLALPSAGHGWDLPWTGGIFYSCGCLLPGSSKEEAWAEKWTLIAHGGMKPQPQMRTVQFLQIL